MNNLPESEKNSNIYQINRIKHLQRPPLPKQSSSVHTNDLDRKTKTLRNQYQCDQRKQNNLASRFHKKKQQLFDITKQNIRLFQKINSQKSLYSHQSLYKSYQSSRSLINSRFSNQSKNKGGQKRSQISDCSQRSQKQIQSKENTFYRRTKSVSSIKKPNGQEIIRNRQGNSLQNLQDINAQSRKAQDLNKLSRLFKIKQQASVKQRNRPIRIRSTKLMKPLKLNNQITNEKAVKYPNSRQIVINEENQVEIHEQILIEEFSPHSKKKNMIRESKNVVLIATQNKNREALQQDKRINMIPAFHTQQSQKSQLKLSSYRCSTQRQKTHNQNNNQNLFEIRNSLLKSRLQKKFGEGVSTKYKNLLNKINTELNKHKIKSTKQTTLNSFKSRLIV